jgi:hypothetical protein
MPALLLSAMLTANCTMGSNPTLSATTSSANARHLGTSRVKPLSEHHYFDFLELLMFF